VRTKAAADAENRDVFAREMQLRRVDVQRVKAFGSRTVFVPTRTGAESSPMEDGGMSSAMAVGLAAGMGSKLN